MTFVRVIPVLLLRNAGLVKTKQFKEPKYIGDPVNAVKIFNEKEVDEIIFLNILASTENKPTPLGFLEQIAGECFMPLSYGGGIKTLDEIKNILKVGVEKVIVNTHAVRDLNFIKSAVDEFGSSTICVSVDVKKYFWGRYEVYTHGGKVNTRIDPVQLAKEIDKAGAGELMITSIDRDGTMEGYDLDLIKSVTENVNIPVIASGGAGNITHFAQAVNEAGASAVAAGSFFIFHGRHKAILITYPSQEELKGLFNSKETNNLI
jgi:imidazole glycerol-phosphate synthase subunit HisF